MALMLALLLLASVPPAAADCSVMSPCGECGDDHCTIAGCPFRGFECNAQNDNQPDEVADTCRYNVIDPGYDGYAYYNGGSCQDMCETFGLDCLRMEEYSDNLCDAHFVAAHDCSDTMDDAYSGHSGHAFCTCTTDPSNCGDVLFMDFYTFCPEGYDYPASESVCASIADDYGYSYEGAEGPYGTGHPPCFHAFEGGSNGMAWVYGYSSSECSDMSGDWDDLGAVCVRVGGPYDTMGCTESSTGACASASTSVSTTCPITREFCENHDSLADNCNCGDCGYWECGDCDCDYYGENYAGRGTCCDQTVWYHYGDEDDCEIKCVCADSDGTLAEVDSGKTWWECEDLCSDHEMHMPCVSSYEDSAALGEWSGLAVWIGYTDSYSEGSWQWTSTSGSCASSTYTNWDALGDEPNGGNGENCAAVWTGTSGRTQGAWNDWSCETRGECWDDDWDDEDDGNGHLIFLIIVLAIMIIVVIVVITVVIVCVCMNMNNTPASATGFQQQQQQQQQHVQAPAVELVGMALYQDTNKTAVAAGPPSMQQGAAVQGTVVVQQSAASHQATL